MKTMKEIAELAERKIDSMNVLPKRVALQMDYVSVVDVLMYAVGDEHSPEEIEGITPEYKYRVMKKAAEYLGGMIEAALEIENEYGINHALLAVLEYKKCYEWLRWQEYKEKNPAASATGQ